MGNAAWQIIIQVAQTVIQYAYYFVFSKVVSIVFVSTKFIINLLHYVTFYQISTFVGSQLVNHKFLELEKKYAVVSM